MQKKLQCLLDRFQISSINPKIEYPFLLFLLQQKALQKHCVLYRASRHGIERLEICDKEDDKNPKIITLENCVKITQEPAPANQINIVKKTNENLTLFALNEIELKHWVEALQSVAFKEKSSTLTRVDSVREKENDLYCTSYSDGIFTVNLLASDATLLKNSIEPKTYTLQLTATEIQLKHLDINGVTLIAKWPYRYIRKYGYRDGKFTFEAGRKCDTGEGEVKFQHSNPIEVFRCMGAKMKSMKKLINGDNSSSLDCSEHQLNAALCMEAGSRSPLPPSPNQNYSESSQSQNSHLLHGFLSSTDSLNNLSMNTSTTSTTSTIPPVVMKITPCKPPRKSIPSSSDSNIKPRNDVPPPPSKSNASSKSSPKYQDYEPVSLAQTGTNDLNKPPGSIVLKSSPPPPLPTSPIPTNGNLTKNILPLVPDHPTSSSSSSIKTPVHSPVVDQPPRIPARYESMQQQQQQQDDRNYERIENITSAWKTLGVSEVKHTENLSTSEDDFTDFVWQRSQSQKEFGSSRKIPVTVNAFRDDEELGSKKKSDDYDKLNFFAVKSPNPASDYRTIVTITSPPYKKQTSQPITSNDYEIIDDCTTATAVNSSSSSGSTTVVSTVATAAAAAPKAYRLADDSYMGYGVLRKPVSNIVSPQSAVQMQSQANTIRIGTSTSADDLVNHKKFNGQNYAIVNKSNQV